MIGRWQSDSVLATRAQLARAHRYLLRQVAPAPTKSMTLFEKEIWSIWYANEECYQAIALAKDSFLWNYFVAEVPRENNKRFELRKLRKAFDSRSCNQSTIYKPNIPKPRAVRTNWMMTLSWLSRARRRERDSNNYTILKTYIGNVI